MTQRALFVVAVAAALGAAPLAAQDTTTAVAPGMTEAQVRARWGEPVAVRRANEWTYLFFQNGREREWGYYDTVFLQNDQVVDAIIRMPGRVYLGQSSSPPDRLPEFTPPQQRPEEAAGAVTGVRVTQPATPNPQERPER